MSKPVVRSEPEYVLIESGKNTMFIERKVWEHSTFRELIGGRLVGEGMTYDEAVAMKQLMDSSKATND